MQTSSKGIALIKLHEGHRERVYYDGNGFATIGYGHKLLPGEDYTVLQEGEAEAILKNDLKIAEEAVTRLVDIGLNQHQFDALVSLVFNIGAGAFQRSKTRRALNQRNIGIAVDEWFGFNRIASGPSSGLIRRRSEEILLFLS